MAVYSRLRECPCSEERTCCGAAASHGTAGGPYYGSSGPSAALGPRPRVFKVICMRNGPTQAARTPCRLRCARTCPHLASSPMISAECALTSARVLGCSAISPVAAQARQALEGPEAVRRSEVRIGDRSSCSPHSGTNSVSEERERERERERARVVLAALTSSVQILI
jgi:hypothetical protein